MKPLIAAAAVIVAIAASTPTLAATEKMYFVTVDTVGNCSVSQGKPSAGQKTLGEAGGYDTIEAAEKQLEEVRKDEATCKGVVE